MCKLRKNDSKGRTLGRSVIICYTEQMLVKKTESPNKLEMEQTSECPLCLDPLEMDDVNFFPCKCGYQVCRFCWHRIRTNESGLCPACRRLYPEDPANFKPLSSEDLLKLKNQKKKKELQKKQKLAENRSHLANLRVIQKNLVFVVGLPQGLNSDQDKMEKMIAIFKPFGAIHKSMVNDRTKYAGTQGPSACAYITYQKTEDALKVLRNRSNFTFDGRSLKVSLGTTKYCSNFLKGAHCPKQDCMYLHEIAEDQACYTKEDIYAGKQVDYENSLIEKFLNKSQHRNISQGSKVSEVTVCNSKKIVNNISDENYPALPDCKEPDVSGISNNHLSPGMRDVETTSLISPENINLLNNSSSDLDCSKEIVSDCHLSANQLFQKEHNHTIPVHNEIPDFQELPSTLQNQSNGFLGQELKNMQQSESLHLDQSSSSNTSQFSSPQSTCNRVINSPPVLHTTEAPNTVSRKFDLFSWDADLDFDPCQEALNALQELVISEAKEKKKVHYLALNKSPFNDIKRRPVLPVNSIGSVDSPHSKETRQQLVQKDPPPGFLRNGLQQSHLFRPGIETVNSFPCQIPPVLMQNQFNVMRNTSPVQRFHHPGVSPPNNSVNNMPYISDYSHYSPCERQNPIAQLPFNQRLQPLSPPQIFNQVSEHQRQVSPPIQHHMNQAFFRPPSEPSVRSITSENPLFMFSPDMNNQAVRRLPNGSFNFYSGNPS